MGQPATPEARPGEIPTDSSADELDDARSLLQDAIGRPADEYEAPPVLAITAEAHVRVIAAREEEGEAEVVALWVEIDGIGDGEYSYDLYFDAFSGATPGDAVSHHEDDLSIVVPESSVDELRGATLGVPRDGGPGLSIINPNRPAGGGEEASPDLAAVDPATLSGTVEERVGQLLREHVNPSLAVHGGQAELVAVEETTAYIRLGGGCQGCGMAPVTLTQGIEVVLTQSVPEVEHVTDVTDHADGTNPYYEPAKS